MEISVVIPTYNRESTIQKTLESVLNQTSRPMEIIVVDDGSTDRTIDIVKGIKVENSIIRLIRMKRNRGAQAARNIGIKVAKGEWIAFLDSDDEWTNDKIEVCQKIYEEHPGYDVYFSDFFIRENNHIRRERCVSPDKQGNHARNILCGARVLFPTMVVKKQALEDIGYLDEKVAAYQEWDTNIRLSVKHKYYHIRKPLFIYNLYDGETISKNVRKAVNGYRYTMINNGELFLELGIKGVKMYLNGMYVRYKRCKDFRWCFYWFADNVLNIFGEYTLVKKGVIRLIRGVWKRQRVKWER